jgi:putative addiction module component (TIGR02574 family)
MTTPLPADLVARVQALSPAEKLQLIGDLWDDLSSEPESIPIHSWQKKELDRRKADLLQNPSSFLAEEELNSRLRERRGEQ